MPLNTPIFRKLLGSAVLLTAFTLFVVDFYLTRYTAQREVQVVEQRLTAMARVLAGELSATPPGNLRAWVAGAAHRAAARVTLIDPAGVVLADSEHAPEDMENHAHRPEVRQALAAGAGSSMRHSDTVDRNLSYLAFRLDYGGVGNYVLRLAVPLESVEAEVREVRWRILGALLAAGGLALAIAFFSSRYFTLRINKLLAFAEGLVQARFTQPALPEGADELGSLGRSLNRMASQLKDLVEGLQLESARREAILASMVEGVLVVDGELRVIFCNQAFARLVAAAPPGPHAPLAELVRDGRFVEIVNRVVGSGEVFRERVRLSSVPARVFQMQAAPLGTASRAGAVAILHDITDLERLERVRKDFVANVSHELRTPLTAIRGYAETLLEGGLEDEQNNRRFVEIIKSHAMRLNNIASDLLTLSELEQEHSVVEKEPVPVAQALETARRTVESEARGRGVTLLIDDVDPEVCVLGQRLRVEQALVNLLANAVKFNRAGGDVRVQVSTTPEGRVRISIRDTGIGIPAADLPRIFERFYRVDKARSRQVGGTGLGLSIVKHVVEQMKGAIHVESEPGTGSTFTLLLPSADLPHAVAAGELV